MLHQELGSSSERFLGTWQGSWWTGPVFVSSHRPLHFSRALMFSAWFELLHFRTEAIFLFAHLPPHCTSMSLDFGACPRSWMSSLFLKPSGQSFWIQRRCQGLDKYSLQSRATNRGPHAYHVGPTRIQSSVCERRRASLQGSRLSRRRYGRTNRVKQEAHLNRSAEQALPFPAPIVASAIDTLLGRLDREKDRGTFTVINLAKVASVAAQSAHTKHIEVAPGISFNLGTHEPPEASGDSMPMGLAQWLLNLRISLQLLLNHRCSESGYFSKLRSDVVSHTLSTLSPDLATANIPWYQNAAKPLECCKWQSSILVPAWSELLRLGAEGGCLTFDAFNKAFIEKQSLFHCALSPQTQVYNVAKTPLQHQAQKRAADSRTSDRQTRRKQIPRTRNLGQGQQYSKYTPDGTLICPDYNTRGCSPNKCWYKSLNAVHCCDVWGSYKEHPRWDH